MLWRGRHHRLHRHRHDALTLDEIIQGFELAEGRRAGRRSRDTRPTQLEWIGRGTGDAAQRVERALQQFRAALKS